MGTITDKLLYLNETKSELRDAINLLVKNDNQITSSDPFRDYVRPLLSIYDRIPTVSGEGENIALNDTIEGKLTINLKGNTSQTGTPTPTSPIPVNVVSGDNEVDIVGKNLFNGTGWRLVQSGNGFPQPGTGATIVSSDENNISFTSTYQTYAGVESGFIKVKANETYMLSVRVTTPTNRFFITQYDENKTRISTLNSANVSTLQNTSFITTNNGYISVAFTNTTTSPTTYKIEDIQIEKGPIATTYEPYTSQNYTISLGDTELCKIGTYQDYIYKDSGKWYLKKYIKKIVFNGTQAIGSVNTSSTNTTRVSYNGLANGAVGISSGGAIKCNKLVQNNNWSTDSEGIVYDAGNGALWFRINKATIGTTQNEVNTYLENNNLIAYFPLATPTDTEITNTTLLTQLEALKGAMSYEGQTNISQVNNDLPFILKGKALKDSELFH